MEAIYAHWTSEPHGVLLIRRAIGSVVVVAAAVAAGSPTPESSDAEDPTTTIGPMPSTTALVEVPTPSSFTEVPLLDGRFEMLARTTTRSVVAAGPSSKGLMPEKGRACRTQAMPSGEYSTNQVSVDPSPIGVMPTIPIPPAATTRMALHLQEV